MDESGRWSLPEQVCIDVGRLLLASIFRLRVEGAANIPSRGGALIICNHPTYLDPALLTLAMPRPVAHLALKTPWRYPSVGYFLNLFGCIPVEPGENAVLAIRAAVRAVRDGRLLIVFPEGGLSDRGRLKRFHPGASRVALEAQCPVIPVAVCGSYAAWPAGSVVPKFRPVTVRIGEPLNLRRAYGRRRNTRLLQVMSYEMQAAVARLYTPWDPRTRPSPELRRAWETAQEA